MANQVREHNQKVMTHGFLRTLAVFDVLGKNLSAWELCRYSWGQEMSVSEVCPLAAPYRLGGGTAARYGLRDWSRLSDEKKRGELVAEYWLWVAANRKWLALVPYVKMVAVMNSLAHDNVHADSDIDLLVVTKKGRLWVARGIMLLLLKVLGKRAWGMRRACKFSPEFFVDEDHLNVSDLGSRSLYLKSIWVADMTPVVYGEYFNKFWNANSWLAEYLPMAYRSPRLRDWGDATTPKKPLAIKVVEWILSGGLGDRIEDRVRKAQQQMIAKNVTRLGESPTILTTNYVCKAYFRDSKPDAVDEAVAKFLARED